MQLECVLTKGTQGGGSKENKNECVGTCWSEGEKWLDGDSNHCYKGDGISDG